MSCSYAEGLSPYENKGKLGLPESFDGPDEVDRKVTVLSEWVRKSGHTVFYTGAGVSTSAGIPDFRGPRGVWTLEERGLRPDVSVSWNEAKPTKTHMAMRKMVQEGLAAFVVSQNIDGLHMRSGLPRRNLAELHGNMFVDACKKCNRMFVRSSPAPTVGQKPVGLACPGGGSGFAARRCRGKLVDFVLDWEHELPATDLSLSDSHSVLSELSVVVGSTLQIVPAGTMPTEGKKHNPAAAKLVIVNLQPTKHDKKADLVIRAYCDDVFEKLCRKLGLDIPPYSPEGDPTRRQDSPTRIEWTQEPSAEVKQLERLSQQRIADNRLSRKRKGSLGSNDLVESLKSEVKVKQEAPPSDNPATEAQLPPPASDSIKEESK